MEAELAAPTRETILVWVYHSLGIRYTLLFPLLLLLGLFLAILAAAKFKTPHLTAVLLIVVPLPIYYGFIGTIDGLLASWQVISSSGITPKSNELSEGAAMSLVSMQVGLILSLPLYFFALFTLCYRAFSTKFEQV
jgi:hypothetical protein